MAANGRGQLRPNPGGRTPPFLVIGLLVVISILGYNYWTVSSKNASLNDEIQQLETRYSAVDRSKRDTEELAKKLTDDNGALQRQTKECEGRLSDQANTAAQTQGELRDKIDNVDRELEDTRRELMTCEDEAYSCTQNITATMLAHKKHLEDLSQRCHLDLEAERTKASQNMEQIQDSCKGMVDARRLSILRTVQTLFGSRAIELLSQNAQMDISGIDLSLGTNNAQAQNLAGGLLVGQQQAQQPLIQQQNLQTPDAAQGMPAQPINNLQPPQAIDDNQVEGQAQQIQDAPDNVEENKQADVNTNQVEAGNNEAEVDTNRAESENNQEEIITNQDQAEENPPAADDNNGDMANDSANQFNAQFNLSPETQAINQQQGSFYQVQNANNLQAINQPLLGQQPLIQQPVVQDPANQEAFQQSLDQQQFQQAEQPINPQFGDHGPAMFNQQLPSIDQPFQQPINQQFPGAYDQQQVQEGMNQEFVGQPQVQEPVNQPADTNEIPAIGAPGDQVVQREQSYQEYIDKQADAYQQYGDKRDADAYEEDNNKDEYDEEENRDGLVGQGVGLGGEDEYQQEVPALADERDMLEGQEPQDDRYQAPVGDNQPIVQYDMPQDQRLDQEQYVNQGMEQGLLIGAPSDTDTQGRLGEAVVQSGR